VRVARVVLRSPAGKAGLLAGDLILLMDGKPVSHPQQILAALAARSAGSRLGLALRRGTVDRLVALDLGEIPDRDEIYRLHFVDQPAPALDLLEMASGSRMPTLAAQRGKVVLLEFWAPWCVACRALIPRMNRWHAEYAPRGVSVLGITGDPVQHAAAAAAALGMEYPVASDTSGRTAEAYQARAIPAIFVIDRAGRVRDVVIGYDAERLDGMDDLLRRLVAER
jgi:peroxiredoxin